MHLYHKNLFYYQIMGHASVFRYGTAGTLGMTYTIKGAGINGRIYRSGKPYRLWRDTSGI
jgi:hypothetical protein